MEISPPSPLKAANLYKMQSMYTFLSPPLPPPKQPSFFGPPVSRLREFIPIHFTQKNGFDSIAEWLNIIRGGHLRIVATKDIPPKTEVVMDYHITRACFHPTSCTNSKLVVLCIAKIFTKMFGNK